MERRALRLEAEMFAVEVELMVTCNSCNEKNFHGAGYFPAFQIGDP